MIGGLGGIINVMKTCCTCHESRPVEEFHKGARRCKACSKACRKVWYDSHREYAIEQTRMWQQANHERVNKQTAARRATPKGREARRVEAQAYRDSHPGVCIAAKHRLRAKAVTAENLLSSTDWESVMSEQGGHCFYCHEAVPLTIDHKIPLSRGGANSRENVVAACLPCNSRKNKKTVQEWREHLLSGARRRWKNETPDTVPTILSSLASVS